MLIPNVFSKFTYHPKGIIHIGAHLCEERDIYNQAGCGDQSIIWIEANPNIVEKARSMLPNSVQLHQAVISDQCGTIDFNVSNNYQSSSILPLGRHKVYHPDVSYVETMHLETITLPVFLKKIDKSVEQFDTLIMDIQGSEMLALKGALELLPYFRAIYLEVNTEEIYEGCGLLNDIKALLQNHGFRMVDINMTSCHWGDAFFMKI